MTLKAQLLVLLSAVLIAFGAGWRVKAAFVAERDLAIMDARDAMISEYRANEAGKAQILENKLADLRANERVIEKEKLKIVDRPIYKQECLDYDGLILIERARNGHSTGNKDSKLDSGSETSTTR